MNAPAGLQKKRSKNPFASLSGDERRRLLAMFGVIFLSLIHI